MTPKKQLVILFYHHSLFFLLFYDNSQDPESASKILWLDEIQHAVYEANMHSDKAKQCKPLPPFAVPYLYLLVLLNFSFNS